MNVTSFNSTTVLHNYFGFKKKSWFIAISVLCCVILWHGSQPNFLFMMSSRVLLQNYVLSDIHCPWISCATFICASESRYKKVLMAAICLYSPPTMRSLYSFWLLRSGGGRGGAICLFFSWLMRRALPACLAAANVGKQMCAHRFNQILAKLWSGEEKDLQNFDIT